MDAPAVTPFISIPALAAAFRRAENLAPHAGLAQALGIVPQRREMNGDNGVNLRKRGNTTLVPMYRISPTSPEPAAEAAAAAQVIIAVADRLRRLAAAYGEWTDFDAEAYFDLTPAQTTLLLDLTERVTSVHLSFFIDPLLPSFQEAAHYWQQCFQPRYLQMQQDLAHRQQMPQESRRVLALAAAGAFEEADRESEPESAVDLAQRFFEETQPAMIGRWQRLLAVAHHTRRLLTEDPSFWALNAANDERLRRRWAWRERPATGLDTALLPKLKDVPTLTLSIDFPLPAYRQPGRLRRLRRGRARQVRSDRREARK